MTTTTPIKFLRLEAFSASGSKFYSIEINEDPDWVEKTGIATQRFTVDFSYGAVGGSIKSGTKTPRPVALDKAEAIMDKLRMEKQNGESHYHFVEERNAGVPAFAHPSLDCPPAAASRFPDLAERKYANYQMNKAAFGAIGIDAPPKPLPACIPPRLLNDVDHDAILNLTKLDNWWVQIKHDGDRVQLHWDHETQSIVLYSGRSAKTRACPAAIAEACAGITDESFVLDGELVGETLWVFDLLKSRSKVHTFDLIAAEASYKDRYALLIRSLASWSRQSPRFAAGAIRLVIAAQTYEEKAELILKAKEEHAEGVVFVNNRAPYRAGRPNRGGDNLRWKFIASGSFIVHSHNMDKGKMSIDVALYDGTVIGTCSVIGKEVPAIGAICEIAYLYCLEKLVQARLKGVRTDVPRIACNRRQLKFRDGIDPSKGRAR